MQHCAIAARSPPPCSPYFALHLSSCQRKSGIWHNYEAVVTWKTGAVHSREFTNARWVTKLFSAAASDCFLVKVPCLEGEADTYLYIVGYRTECCWKKGRANLLQVALIVYQSYTTMMWLTWLQFFSPVFHCVYTCASFICLPCVGA
jgi:hypothetical protein